jgi:ATP-dependent RNA helicase RhlE
MTFFDLNLTKKLLHALTDMGFTTPTTIQEKAYPAILSGRDTVAIAQTGTGKTLAYLLPILRNLAFSEQKQPRIMILVPTRELVEQVCGEIEKLCKYSTVRFAGIYGGANINTQKQLIMAGLDILVATPGRVMDMILNSVLKVNHIQKLVIDEVDEMFDIGFRPQVNDILLSLPEKRQNLMFSATITEEIDALIKQFFFKPQYVELVKGGAPLSKIQQFSYAVPNFYTKVNLLEYLLETSTEFKKTLVFVKNKKLADLVYNELQPVLGNTIGCIHSNKTQPQRFAAIERLESGEIKTLIATDIISRGLDIPEVSHVVNFDTPSDKETYIHRIGRTGRADKSGFALTFYSETEKPAFEKIIESFKNNVQNLPIPEAVEIADALIEEEKTKKTITNQKKLPKVAEYSGGGAFHEKKTKNKKINLGGKRRQEKLKRKEEAYKRKRGI